MEEEISNSPKTSGLITILISFVFSSSGIVISGIVFQVLRWEIEEKFMASIRINKNNINIILWFCLFNWNVSFYFTFSFKRFNWISKKTIF